MLSSVVLSSSIAAVILGSLLTLSGLLIVAFITFFLRRLVQQLDRNTLNNESVSRSLSSIEVRLSALEAKTATVVLQKEIPTSHEE